MRHLQIIFLIILLSLTGNIFAESAMDIIRRVDSNDDFQTQKYTATMTIKKGKRTLVKTMSGYGAERGEKAFIEFTNPADKGVKYLKIEDELWIYFPDADDIMKISGHMLRQGMMGSDISYEDMMSSETLEEDYSAKLLGSKTVRGRDCYEIELTAKTNEALYAKEIVRVDKEWYTALSLELYAHGGRLIKTMEQYDVKNIQGRNIATRTIIEDKRRKNSSTTITLDELVINAKLPSGVFSHSYLRK